MYFYYIFTKGSDWIKLSGSGSNPIKCDNVKFSCNKGNKEIGIVNNLESEYHPVYKGVMNYKDNENNLLVQVNKFGSLIKYGYRHNKNNFPEIKKVIPINKGEKVIQVKATSKRKAHKRVIITRDLDRIGDKTKAVKGIITTDYNESIKNTNDYISKLYKSHEGRKILESINDYTSYNFISINEYMKTGKIIPSKSGITYKKEEIINKINDIKQFIKDAPKFEGEVYRGIKYNMDDPDSKNRQKSFINNIERSDKIKFGSFISTTNNIYIARSFTNAPTYKNINRCIITIKTKSGVSIERLSKSPEEEEVLLNFDKTYKIINFDKSDLKKIKLELEEI